MSEARFRKPSDAEGARLLARLMLAWDGQWFLKTAEGCGLDKAVELNARVRASFGRIEMREYTKTIGVDRVGNLEEAARIIEGYAALFFGEGLEVRWALAAQDTAEVFIERCVAQEGAQRAGLRPDTPCVACEKLWSSWLGALLKDSTWETTIPHSLGRGADHCEIRLRKSNDPASSS